MCSTYTEEYIYSIEHTFFLIDVSKGLVVRTIDRWGPNYKIGFDFKVVNSIGSGYHNLLHLTETDNQKPGFKKGGRIPGIWFVNESKRLKFHVGVTGLRGRQETFETFTEINQWYSIQMEQNGGKFNISIDGEFKQALDVESTEYRNVKWYQSDLWYDSMGNYIQLKKVQFCNNI